MTLEKTNPYAPPSTTSQQRVIPTANGSTSLSIVSGLCAVAYITFTVMLLRSTPGDRKAGLMFAGNAPVMVGLAISAAGSLRLARYFAVGATCLQVLITIALLALDVGEASMIIGINALIILPCLVLASWAWRLHHLRWMKAERIADRTTAESSPVAPSG